MGEMTCDATANAVEVVRIRGIASDGAGVGDLPDGRAVFVPRTAPGDEVRIRVTKLKRRWARGRVLEVLSATSERTDPACSRYDECGGCTLQHIPYGEQLVWKTRFVHDALQRIAHLDLPPTSVRASPECYHYRSRITFTLIRLPGGRVVSGFHRLDRPDRIVDVADACVLPVPAITAAWKDLQSTWGAGARRLPSGRRLRLTLREVDEGVILMVEGGNGPGRPDILLKEVEGLVAVWATSPQGGGRLLGGLADVHDTRLGDISRAGPSAFTQVNEEAAEALHECVLSEILSSPADLVVDAYCGAGLYGRRIAKAGHRAIGIETNAEAARAADQDAPEGFSVLTGAVEHRLAETLPADAVILNPPRAGVDERVTDLLRGEGPPKLIYVSCDPATLARDLARLGSTYDVDQLHAFDLFPQTAHVEVVAVLQRSAVTGASG